MAAWNSRLEIHAEGAEVRAAGAQAQILRANFGVFGGASFTWGPISPQRSEANDKTQLTRAEKETAK